MTSDRGKSNLPGNENLPIGGNMNSSENSTIPASDASMLADLYNVSSTAKHLNQQPHIRTFFSQEWRRFSARLVFSLLLLISLVFVSNVAFSQTERDNRVASQLEGANLDYQMREDGSFAVTFVFSNDRSQVVTVRSRTESFGDIEFREVYSMCYKADGDLTPLMARSLLAENTDLKIGAWVLSRFDGKSYVSLSAEIPAVADSKSLLQLLAGIAIAADEKEQTLMDGDPF